jgi:hypothetical protein
VLIAPTDLAGLLPLVGQEGVLLDAAAQALS